MSWIVLDNKELATTHGANFRVIDDDTFITNSELPSELTNIEPTFVFNQEQNIINTEKFDTTDSLRRNDLTEEEFIPEIISETQGKIF